jgi:membrane protein
MVAAGVAFSAMLALFPALIAIVTFYALVSKPNEVSAQVTPLVRGLPAGVGNLLRDELHDAVAANHPGLTIGLAASLIGTVWTASCGVNALTRGLAVILDAPPVRSPLRRRVVSIALTLGGLVAAAVALALVCVFPMVLGHVGLGRAGRLGAEVLRWFVLLVLVLAALAVVYRLAVSATPGSRWRLVTWGVSVALVMWIIASVVFTLYVSNFSRFNKMYGSLAAFIVLMVWLYLSSFAILLGAVVDAELSARRTARRGT